MKYPDFIKENYDIRLNIKIFHIKIISISDNKQGGY